MAPRGQIGHPVFMRCSCSKVDRFAAQDWCEIWGIEAGCGGGGVLDSQPAVVEMANEWAGGWIYCGLAGESQGLKWKGCLMILQYLFHLLPLRGAK